MEIRAFILPDETVALLNDVLRETGYRVFVARDMDDAYTPRDHVSAETLLQHMNLEIGPVQHFQKIAGMPLRAVYREHRVGLVSTYLPKLRATNVLLESNFRADPSPAATAVGKAIHRWLRKNANQGVLVRAEGMTGERVARGIWWTEKARESRRTWKQAESSVVYFVPTAWMHDDSR